MGYVMSQKNQQRIKYCVDCGKKKSFPSKSPRCKSCAIKHLGWMGPKHPKWKGGTYRIKSGYIVITTNNNRGYAFAHRMILEKKLGRKLTAKERVHHINEDKADNRIKNLYLCKNVKVHMTVHKQLEALALELVRADLIRFSKGKYHLTKQLKCGILNKRIG